MAGAGRLSDPARRNANSGRCSSMAPFCPCGIGVTGPDSAAQCAGAFLCSDTKKPENKLSLFSDPNRVGIHAYKPQVTCSLIFAAEKQVLPDCLTAWFFPDRQGIVSPTPSPVLPNLLRPNLLRPEIQSYCSMAVGERDRWRYSTIASTHLIYHKHDSFSHKKRQTQDFQPLYRETIIRYNPIKWR